LASSVVGIRMSYFHLWHRSHSFFLVYNYEIYLIIIPLYFFYSRSQGRSVLHTAKKKSTYKVIYHISYIKSLIMSFSKKIIYKWNRVKHYGLNILWHGKSFFWQHQIKVEWWNSELFWLLNYVKYEVSIQNSIMNRLFHMRKMAHFNRS
jgi:hypothetical protein